MTRPNGAISLAYMRGDKNLPSGRYRKYKYVDMDLLTKEQEIQVREEARKTGEPFIVVASRILANQRKLEDFDR